ncbi:anti-sigma regulatory factor [Bacillus sp. REN3]|uniref:anti-sigma regulatory factor n=1 Tax=Bacillus sp. REN3 TaxID=2802440 RepID=UPI001AED9BA7|nr:anti-sigma regulatory factor [Bacillus sp. REN3]
MEIEHIVRVVNEWDIIKARSLGRKAARELGFNAVDQARIVVVVSELARNIVKYAGSGEIRISCLCNGSSKGMHIHAADEGPGMDIRQVLKDGYSTSRGLGAGLPGIKRLMDSFIASSSPGSGTSISATLWLKNSAGRVTT